jgi:hypothetical protein
VNLTGVELVAQARAVRRWGFEVWGSVHGGLLHLGYDPDELTYEPGGGIGPITVAYAAIDEWDAGAGVEIRRELARHLALAVAAEATTFALDTAHRRGSEIVESRDRFYLWSVRLQLSWRMPLG